MTPVKTFFRSIGNLLKQPGALLVFAAIYALLLVALYFFISTREATVWQVFVTYTLMIGIPALFFIYQAAIIDRVREQNFRWRFILIDALKFFFATIPMLLLAWLIQYLLNKWQLRYPAPVAPTLPIAVGPPPAQPLHWASLIFATLRFVLLGVILPLATIHVWIAVAGGEVRSLFAGGAKPFGTRIGAALARALASDSVLIYALGLILFFAIPYAILFVPLNIKGNKTDFAVLILRLVLTFIFSLIGWVVTLSALTRNFEVTPVAAPDPVPVPMEMVA